MSCKANGLQKLLSSWQNILLLQANFKKLVLHTIYESSCTKHLALLALSKQINQSYRLTHCLAYSILGSISFLQNSKLEKSKRILKSMLRRKVSSSPMKSPEMIPRKSQLSLIRILRKGVHHRNGRDEESNDQSKQE